jgi:hypothetical protein
MTSKDLRDSVERIKDDPEFARRAYEHPEAVLPVEYDLDPAQWQAVHRALVADVDEGDDEVGGFQADVWGVRQNFVNLDALVSPRDAATGQASGKRSYKPIRILKEWGGSSP